MWPRHDEVKGLDVEKDKQKVDESATIGGLQEEVARLEEEYQTLCTDFAIANGQRDRLWKGINGWLEGHKRTCYNALSGGFCAECKWVMDLIKAEEGTTLNPEGVKEETPSMVSRRRVIDQGQPAEEPSDERP